MTLKNRVHLAWKVLTGRMVKTTIYYNPVYGVTEVTLRDKKVNW